MVKKARMAHFDQSHPTKEVADFLVHVREQGTPLRVDSETETYYVLTAAQLVKLLQSEGGSPGDDIDVDNIDLATNRSFSLQDFGLTEADLVAYERQQRVQRAAVNSQKQHPLRADLKQRLDALPALERLSPQRAAQEREQLLEELEAAMLNNLHVLLSKPKS